MELGEIVTVIGASGGSAVVSGSVAWVLGGRRRANAEVESHHAQARVLEADAAKTAVGAAGDAIALVREEMRQLADRVAAAEQRSDLAEQRAGAAERRADVAEKHVALLVATVQVQQAAAAEMRQWSQRAAEALRAAHIEIDDPPKSPDIAIPVAVHGVSATTTTTTTRLEA